MPKTDLLYHALRGPWTQKSVNVGGPADILADADGCTLAIFPDLFPYRNDFARAAMERAPDAFRLLREVAEMHHDTRETVDGRIICLWCGADLGYCPSASGDPADIPEPPTCQNSDCTGTATRALLREMEVIADAALSAVRGSLAFNVTHLERNPDDAPTQP